MVRIGILGGTFDPVHNGHIYLAEKVYRKLSLNKLIFIPAYIPPHKKGAKVTPARHRYNMLKLALADNKRLKVSDMEIKRKGKSYSVETLRRLRKRYGAEAEIFFIAGSDSLAELDKWKNLEEIFKLCRFAVIERPGFKFGKPRRDFIRLKINARDISATEIRNKAKKGKSLAGFTPQKVIKYIHRNKLYV